jgi:large subunit ribosomal protein L17
MRHGNKVNALGRTMEHRAALLKNMSCSLIEHKRIMTTLAKAKVLRGYLEPLVTKSKDNSTNNRRVVFSYLQSKEAIKELFGPIAEAVATRPGGYLRVIKTGFRRGDGAETAMIEFVDFNTVYKAAKSVEGAGQEQQEEKKVTRRGGKKKTAAQDVAE